MPFNRNNGHKTTVMNTVFGNMQQLGLTKLNTESRSYQVTSKPVYTAPTIAGGYTDECGTYQYVLEESGHTVPQEKYDSMWHPKRGLVLPKGTKGDNPDKTKIV